MMQHLSRPGADLADPAGLSLVLRSPGRPGPARPIPSLPFRPVHSRYAFFPARNRQDLYQKKISTIPRNHCRNINVREWENEATHAEGFHRFGFLFECFLHGLIFWPAQGVMSDGLGGV